MLLGLVCLWHVISVSMTMDLHFALSLCGCFPPAQVSSFVYSTHNTLLLTQLYNDYVHSGWAQGRANNTVDLSLKAAPVLLLISQDFLLIFDFFFFFFFPATEPERICLSLFLIFTLRLHLSSEWHELHMCFFSCQLATVCWNTGSRSRALLLSGLIRTLTRPWMDWSQEANIS